MADGVIGPVVGHISLGRWECLLAVSSCTPRGRAGDALVDAALGGWNGPWNAACLAAVQAAEALARRRRPVLWAFCLCLLGIIIWSGRGDDAAWNRGELVSVTTSQPAGRAQKIHPAAYNALH